MDHRTNIAKQIDQAIRTLELILTENRKLNLDHSHLIQRKLDLLLRASTAHGLADDKNRDDYLREALKGDGDDNTPNG